MAKTCQYTEEQLRQSAQDALDALTSHGSILGAAHSLGKDRDTIRRGVARAEKLGLKPQTQRLIAAEPAAAPPGYKLKGTSTFYNRYGVPTNQWVKTDADLARLYELQKEVVAELSQELKPCNVIAAPKTGEADLATLYTMTDC